MCHTNDDNGKLYIMYVNNSIQLSTMHRPRPIKHNIYTQNKRKTNYVLSFSKNIIEKQKYTFKYF